MASDSQSESHCTTSTSIVEDALNISFEDLSCSVRHGILKRSQKQILRELNGAFNAGELSVILGQSGAGKSTLMDILAGYSQPAGGNIYVNGRPRNYKVFRRRSCYILQDDMIQEMLTIQESLNIAAELKMGNHIHKDQKIRRVEEIMTSLNLRRSRNTKAGSLSGGQKKRLAIGLELVSDPSVMFLDEPTSGLDSSISKQVIYLLHLLARQGRTVIVTMHQPSAGLLKMVDRLYVMDRGRCAYMGSVPMLIPFLEDLKLTCPPFHSPVDILIEKCSETNIEDLVQYSQNGKSTQWTSSHITHETDNSSIELIGINYVCEEVYLTTLPAPKEDPTSKILAKLKSTYPTSFFKQFVTLTRRSLLALWRNPSFTITITFIHCAMALLIGVLFHNIGEEAKYVRDIYNYLYYSLMFLMFTAFSAVSITFPLQFAVVRREHFNRWYMTGAYFASTIVSAMPTQTVCTLTYACITYWLTGQPLDAVRFFSFLCVLTLVSYVALFIGFLNGSVFKNIKNAVVFGPLLIMPFTIFSGFFLRYQDAPYLFRWMFHASFLKHGLVGLVLTIFGMDRAKFSCPGTGPDLSEYFCYYRDPRTILEESGALNELYSFAIGALLAIAGVIIICTFIILKYTLMWK